MMEQHSNIDSTFYHIIIFYLYYYNSSRKLCIGILWLHIFSQVRSLFLSIIDVYIFPNFIHIFRYFCFSIILICRFKVGLCELLCSFRMIFQRRRLLYSVGVVFDSTILRLVLGIFFAKLISSICCLYVFLTWKQLARANRSNALNSL